MPTSFPSELSLRRRILLTPALLWWQFRRGMTLGVRAVVLDRDNRVFLVRHSYVPGWYIPGGGVEPGETMREAMCRELAEEGNIEVAGEPILHGIFLNRRYSARDHVAVHVVRDFRQTAPKTPDLEIVEAGFFPIDALPKGVTRGSADRIAEVVSGKSPSPWW